MLVIGEAFEAVDLSTHVARSTDLGRTWQLEGALYDKSRDEVPKSDFLKPTVLSDGSLVAVGYRFLRSNPDQPIGIAETGGILPGEDVVSFSDDEGRTWTVPEVITNKCAGFLEIPGPCIATRSGDLLIFGAPFPRPDGTFPAGQLGVLLRSRDRGRSWDNGTPFFDTPGRNINPYESGACEMQDGRIVAIVWAYDHPLRGTTRTTSWFRTTTDTHGRSPSTSALARNHRTSCGWGMTCSWRSNASAPAMWGCSCVWWTSRTTCGVLRAKRGCGAVRARMPPIPSPNSAPR